MKKNTLPKHFWKNPIHFLACGLGSGAMPYAPGTFGTLIAIPIYLLLQPLTFEIYIFITFLLFFMGIWFCHTTARDFGTHDHAGIVWDEIVGYLITMIGAPAGWIWIGVGFILFRLFDILKPWPIRWADKRVEGGFGIMLDDLLAGIYAFVCLQLIYRWEILVNQ